MVEVLPRLAGPRSTLLSRVAPFLVFACSISMIGDDASVGARGDAAIVPPLVASNCLPQPGTLLVNASDFGSFANATDFPWAHFSGSPTGDIVDLFVSHAIRAADCTYNILLGCYGFDSVAGPALVITHIFLSIAAVLGSSQCCNPQHVTAAWIKVAILDTLVNGAFCVAVNLPRFLLRLAYRVFHFSVCWGAALAQQCWCPVYRVLHYFFQVGVALAQLCWRPVAINILSQVLIAYRYRQLGVALPWLSLLLICSRRGRLVPFNYSHSSWFLFALTLLLLPFLGMSMNAAHPLTPGSGEVVAAATMLDIGAGAAIAHGRGVERFGEGTGGIDTLESKPAAQQILERIEGLPWVESVTAKPASRGKPRGGFIVLFRVMEVGNECNRTRRRHFLWTPKIGDEASAKVGVLTKLYSEAVTHDKCGHSTVKRKRADELSSEKGCHHVGNCTDGDGSCGDGSCAAGLPVPSCAAESGQAKGLTDGVSACASGGPIDVVARLKMKVRQLKEELRQATEDLERARVSEDSDRIDDSGDSDDSYDSYDSGNTDGKERERKKMKTKRTKKSGGTWVNLGWFYS